MEISALKVEEILKNPNYRAEGALSSSGRNHILSCPANETIRNWDKPYKYGVQSRSFSGIWFLVDFCQANRGKIFTENFFFSEKWPHPILTLFVSCWECLCGVWAFLWGFRIDILVSLQGRSVEPTFWRCGFLFCNLWWCFSDFCFYENSWIDFFKTHGIQTQETNQWFSKPHITERFAKRWSIWTSLSSGHQRIFHNHPKAENNTKIQPIVRRKMILTA